MYEYFIDEILFSFFIYTKVSIDVFCCRWVIDKPR